jgi:tetratricopeptide (TPR) repeat protein
VTVGRVLLLAFAVATGACAGSPSYAPGYLEAFEAGLRAKSAGRMEEAWQSFDEAYRTANRVKDRDEALYLRARTEIAMKRLDDAEASMKLLVAATPRGTRATRAELELAQLAGMRGDTARQDELERAFLAKHPHEGLAVAALSRVVTRKRAEGNGESLVPTLEALVAPSRGTASEQAIDVELAYALEERGEDERALALLLATARAHPYPKGPRTDDALYRASFIEERLNRPALAIAHLREMLDPREQSGPGGSYERPHFAEARMRIAKLMLDHLKDRDGARDELHRLFADHADSRLRDDALWLAGKIALKDGDASGACSDARRIASALPDSRYAGCVGLLCSDITPPTSKRCADYIARELREPDVDPSGPALPRTTSPGETPDGKPKEPGPPR